MAGIPLGPPPITVVITSCCAKPGTLTSNAASINAIDIVKRRMNFFSWKSWVRVDSLLERQVVRADRQQRTPADLRALLPGLPLGVLEQDHQVRLGWRTHPLPEFPLGNRELLAHLDELLALPDLHRLKIPAQSHGWTRIQQCDDHVSRCGRVVVIQLQMQCDLDTVTLLVYSADVEVSVKVVSFCSGSRTCGDGCQR